MYGNDFVAEKQSVVIIDDGSRSGGEDPEPRRTPEPQPGPGWSAVVTPPLNLQRIALYSGYIDWRIESAINSGEPPSPTLAHVMEKRDKATNALNLLAVHDVERQKTIKRKQLEDTLARATSKNRMMARSGPVVVGDARLRTATDEHNRIALKTSEANRLYKKDWDIEQIALNRWVSGYRKTVQRNIQAER
ncbi:hypothetical protein B0T25DRAFT_446393, partial [Lasiosphaeria hispida]